MPRPEAALITWTVPRRRIRARVGQHGPYGMLSSVPAPDTTETAAALVVHTGTPPSTWSLSEWQSRLADLNRADHAWLTVEEIWLHALRAVADFARVLRTKRDWREGLHSGLPAVLAWVLALGDKLDFSVEEATWAKFPGLCPYCFEASEERRLHEVALTFPGPSPGRTVRPCACGWAKVGRYADADLRLEPLRAERGPMPETLAGWQAMFDGVYGRRHGGSVEALAFHFVEELGEVAAEILGREAGKCEQEVADVVSWVFSLANATAHLLGGPVPSLQEGMDAAYRDRLAAKASGSRA